jgi:hypothetical protein
MQSHDDVFARRLERLAKNDTQGATRHSAPPATPVTPSEKSRKIPPWGLVLASAFLVVSGGAFAALALLPSAATPPVAYAETPLASATAPPKPLKPVPTKVQTATPKESAESIAFKKARDAAIAADKLVRLAALAANETPVVSAEPDPKPLPANLPSAVTYFPKAMHGWLAITPEINTTIYGTGKTKTEVEQVNTDHKAATERAMAKIASQYPGGAAALKAHPRFKKIRQYVGNLPMFRKFQGERKHKSRAIYIAQDGSYLKVELEFLAQADLFGPPDSSRLWGDAIVERLSKRYGTKGVPTGFIGYRGGVAHSDRTSLTEIKQATTGSKPERFDMVLALNHGTQITVYGEISPDHMKRFLRSFDHDALLARVAAIGE